LIIDLFLFLDDIQWRSTLPSQVVQSNGTIVGNPPDVFFSSQNDEYAGEI